MYNLGISCYYHDSAAALLKDGHIVAAVEEERFSRKKFDDDFPKMAIEWCLKEAKIDPSQIDSVAFYDKPILKFERLLDNYIAVAPRGLISFLDTIPKWLHKRLWIKNEIKNAIHTVLNDKKFLDLVKKQKPQHGDGTASRKIIKILEELDLEKIPIQKKITY